MRTIDHMCIWTTWSANILYKKYFPFLKDPNFGTKLAHLLKWQLSTNGDYVCTPLVKMTLQVLQINSQPLVQISYPAPVVMTFFRGYSIYD